MEPVITFENVSKTYPLYHHITGGIKNLIFNLYKGIEAIRNSKYEALHDISFQVFKGETFGIIGKNGAGKSTILGLVAGVLKPTKGRVTVRGRISPLLELGAGFHPELTGRENILLKGVLIGLTRLEITGKMDEIIRFSELDDFIDQPVRIYSSGMLARLGFSIVASLNPELLLIDEILAVGDSEFQKKCLERMAEFKKGGVTMLLVSHSIEQVETNCDRVIWIENHRIKMLGSPLDILSKYPY
ncbi:MAG: ABC transporter ATP-binding protein [Bacteroidetes bacterium]|jgi:lipopolysaccharide transport system ATP-binding protein|nr:ABC transporter ATP-binding protein [Prolixibacteraceae bacterium]MBP8975372.1 ABC transporter ATP-binding protein [Bacteroidota bacterium]